MIYKFLENHLDRQLVDVLADVDKQWDTLELIIVEGTNIQLRSAI